MSEKRLTAEDEQILLMSLLQIAKDLPSASAEPIHTAYDEIRLAWRVRSATGRNQWPSEKQIRAWEAEQEVMRREYEAENKRDGGA